MRNTLIGLGLVTVALVAGVAQTPKPELPRFKVASVKRAEPGGTLLYRQPSADRYIAANVTLEDLVSNAYGVASSLIAGGPDWLDSDRFTIEAKTAAPLPAWPDSGKQLGLMLQSLLQDRFALIVHRETRQATVYELVTAKRGPKLKQADASETAGFGVEPGRLRSRAVPLSYLASNLSWVLGRPVTDRTGLSGKYDYTLVFNPEPAQVPPGSPASDGNAPASADAPSIFTALQEQLGLRLDATKGPVEFLVIDNARRPTVN